MDQQNPLNTAPDLYLSIWSNSNEHKSFEIQKSASKKAFFSLVKKYNFLSVKHELLSPWLILDSKAKSDAKKYAASEDEKYYKFKDNSLDSYLKLIYTDRTILIKRIIHEYNTNKALSQSIITINGIKQNIFFCISTFVIPAFYGHFYGKKNLDSFIEAVGLIFDDYANNVDNLLIEFDGSLLCCILKQFFFSPMIRPYIGEQFTSFFDLLNSMKKNNESQYYLRIQRFLALFLIELGSTMENAPYFLLALFQRITRPWNDENIKYKIILSVILYCILMPIIVYPVSYSVIPLTSSSNQETKESINSIKYYFCVNFNLPLQDEFKAFHTIKENECIDTEEINKFCKLLLRDYREPEPEFEPNFVMIPVLGVYLLLQIEKNINTSQALSNTLISENLSRFSVVKCKFDKEHKTLRNKKQIIIDRIIELVTSQHYERNIKTQKLYVIQEWLSKMNLDYNVINKDIKEINDKKMNKIIKINKDISILERQVLDVKKAINASTSLFADKIATSIFSEVSNEIEKKKKLMMDDPECFSSFLISKVESYQMKNQWVTPIISMVAKKFHSLMMSLFSLNEFITYHKNLAFLDQRFLNQKNKFIYNLEKDVDSYVSKIISKKEVLEPAQTPILRACLFENPVESVKQIVLGLSAVEDLFVFEYGTQPEANQLMPLLANLFILSPVPSPLLFGKWIYHFYHLLQQNKPEWFNDEELLPLEHYFQFNLWIENMLESIDNNNKNS